MSSTQINNNPVNVFSRLWDASDWSARLIYVAYAIAGGWFAFNIIFTASKLASYRYLPFDTYGMLLLVGLVALAIFSFFAYGFVRMRSWLIPVLQLYVLLAVLNLILAHLLEADVNMTMTVTHATPYVLMLVFTLATEDFLVGNKYSFKVIFPFLIIGLLFTALTMFIHIQ